jgi:PAS domain S-box-containing protein
MIDENQLRLLDCLPDAVILVRPDGRIAFANVQTRQLLGYEPSDLSGAPLDLVIPARLRPRHAANLRAYLANPVFRPMDAVRDLSALRKDGRELPVEISLGFVQGAQDVLAVATIRDVSLRRSEEDRLKQALTEIENLRKRVLAENRYLEQELASALGAGEMIGQSEPIRETRRKVDQIGPTDLNALILGETGTGKELVARAIHQRSPRGHRSLVKVNCAALHPELIESELFGHEKGAFTGAAAQKVGRFELANGSTIFLDEVAEIPAHLQAKLLRVLQEKELERVGSGTTIRVDVRVIAATNRDLQAMIRKGSFRADLYFRLAVFIIEVPTLRQRREDIALLAWHIIRQRQAKLGKFIDEIPQDVMDALMAADWPGNIRELENVIERGLVASDGPVFRLGEPITRGKPAPEADEQRQAGGQTNRLEHVERSHILEVLRKCGWKIKGKGNAADRLGLNPSTLRFRMKKLGITRPKSDSCAESPTTFVDVDFGRD